MHLPPPENGRKMKEGRYSLHSKAGRCQPPGYRLASVG